LESYQQLGNSEDRIPFPKFPANNSEQINLC